jgi:hypothetical protein
MSSEDLIEAVTKSQVFAGRDLQIAQLVADRILEGGEPCLPVFPIRVCSSILERWCKIEDHDVSCVMRHETVDVLGAERLHPLLHELANLRLIARFPVFLCHRSVLCSLDAAPSLSVIRVRADRRRTPSEAPR